MICWETNPGIKPSSRISHSQLCCSLVEIPVATNQEKFGIFLLHSCCKPGEIWIFPLFFCRILLCARAGQLQSPPLAPSLSLEHFPLSSFLLFFWEKLLPAQHREHSLAAVMIFFFNYYYLRF